MSELPKLVPITRREPPAGYKAPVYDEYIPAAEACTFAPEEIEAVWEEENTRRVAAKAAAQKALTSYRWWGFTNILYTILLAIQAWRQRREASRQK